VIRRALTILEPSASAIGAGVKPWENRDHLPPSTIKVGDWIALHAGVAPWKRAALVRNLWPDCPPDADLPFGLVIGAWRYGGAYRKVGARLVQATPLLVPGPPELEADPWALGQFCLAVADVVKLEAPIPCPVAPKGKPGATHQGWWFLPDVQALILNMAIERHQGNP
jgi:hypothetical protein